MPDGMDKKIEEYTDSEIRKTVTADYGGVQRRYEKILEKQGRSLDAVREQLRRQIVISGFLDNEVRPRVAEPTRADLYEAFHNNIDAWRRPARRSMSLIDVRISEFLPKDAATPTREQSEAARAEARQRIEAAGSELGTGMPFAEIARKYSQGLHAEEGGAWGYVNRDSVRERFVPAVEALAKLDAGRTSDIIETPDGFFLVRCDALQPAVEPDFQSVQPQLREEFFRSQYNRQIAELVFELRKNARVEPENLEPFHAAVVAGAFNIVELLPTSGR
jgi:parvulin-like peptidyl-prolyl isomerase